VWLGFRGGDAESALRVLHVMGGLGGGMSEWGYGWVLSTCAEAGLWDKALTLYYSMPIQGKTAWTERPRESPNGPLPA
jgi:pentatricopeptide repeat protein